ncbi:MAG: Uma2 family endonuclease [Planctomycetia bacterium]
MTTTTQTEPRTDAPTPNDPPPAETIPPLHNGDHLDRFEFHRRYEAMPEVKKAELIEGIVYMPSPVSLDGHGEQHSDLNGWLYLYRAQTPGVRLGDNATVRLDNDNEPQPDAVLLIESNRGGQSKIVGRYIQGSPELAAEVAASSVSIDRNAKFRTYQRNGVREYVLWRVDDGVVDWFVLRDGRYEPMVLQDGLYRSEVFPGLWLDPAALVAGDRSRVIAVVQQGLASAEHTAFVVSLQKAVAAI